MALGLGKDADEKASAASGNGTGFGGDYEGFGQDVEKQGAQQGTYRKMSRIDVPITGSISAMKEGRDSIDATGAGVSIGQQMEAEAGNAIKYRTCSWQKVWPAATFVPNSLCIQLTLRVDCISTFLRVHLSGYHVFPLVIFHPGPCTWNHLDCRSGRLRPVHIIDCLVSFNIELAPVQKYLHAKQGILLAPS